MFAPFIPHTSEALNTILGQDESLFGTSQVDQVPDKLGEHSVLRYLPNEKADQDRWQPVEILGDRPFNQPYPLIKKLDHSIVDEERARLGK